MKVLYIATSDIHLATFHRPYLKWLSENNVHVDIAVEKRGDISFIGVKSTYYLSFPRSLLNKDLFKSYRELKKIINSNAYDLIHCHTPIPSMIARLAARKARKKGTKVLYTAHGFHFYKGASLSRWLTYYPAEYILSYFTDGIITINHEDFDYINGKMFHKDSFYINGIGVDSSRFKPFSDAEKDNKRQSLNLIKESFVLLYVAEFIPRKNHAFVINALKYLVIKIPEVKILFAGKGVLLNDMRQLTYSLNLSDHIDFLGFRKDVNELSAISDIGISSSKHEGLGLGLTEQMMCKVPIIASQDRGHKEMIVQGETGFMFEQNNQVEFINFIEKLYINRELRYRMGENAFQKAKEFEISNSLNSMMNIYKQYLKTS
jgi:glycosyltransferase EpsD